MPVLLNHRGGTTKSPELVLPVVVPRYLSTSEGTGVRAQCKDARPAKRKIDSRSGLEVSNQLVFHFMT